MTIRACVRSICTTAVIGAALTTAGGREAAATSAGCSAAEAAFHLSARAGEVKSATVMGFVQGDTIVFNVVIYDSSGMWVLKDSKGTVLAKDEVVGANQFTYTVKGTADTTLTEVLTGRSEEQPSRPHETVAVNVVSCTSVTRGTGTDSQKARAVQILGSRVVGQTSGAAITGAIDGAIADGLNGGNSGAPSVAPSADSGLPPFGLGAGSEQMSRLGATTSPRVAPPSAVGSTSEWMPWLNVRGSGWAQDDSDTGSVKGNQINATVGLGRLVAPNVLVGIVGGYENFTYHFDGTGGRLQGDGWTAGAYAGWGFAQNLRFDAMGAWTGLSYDDSAGAAAGSFNASRWLVSTGMTATYRMSGFVVEPSSRLYALWEQQDAWTDSLGTHQAERSFSIGRESTGTKIAYPWQLGAGNTLTPYVGLFGDYRFSSDNALRVNEQFVGLRDGWSARAATGAIMDFKGGRLSLEGEFGGIGSGDQLWTLSVRGSIPFY